MLSSTALVCIVNLTSIVHLVCVCWNVTYAEELLPWFYLVAGASASLKWISLDLHGILAIVWTPAYSLVSICVFATPAPCLQHHVIVSTAQKVSPTSLLPAQSVAI